MKRTIFQLIIIFLTIVLPTGNTFSALESNTEIEEPILNEVQEAGTYPVTIQYVGDNGEIEKAVIYVTIHYPRTVESQEHREAIDGHDVEIERGTFSQLDDVQMKRLTGVHAWNTENGAEIEVVRVERIIVDEKLGVYQVRFSTAKNTQTLVNVVERDKVYSKKTTLYVDFLDTIRFQRIEWSMLFLLFLPIVLLYINYRRSLQQIKNVDRLLHQKIRRK